MRINKWDLPRSCYRSKASSVGVSSRLTFDILRNLFPDKIWSVFWVGCHYYLDGSEVNTGSSVWFGLHISTVMDTGSIKCSNNNNNNKNDNNNNNNNNKKKTGLVVSF